MPRLFWKLFFALWLSIMAFAVVVAWINQTVITQHAVEEPAQTFEANLLRLEVKLARDLKEGGERRMKRTLQNLPRGMRNHVFVLNSQGKELLGRERALQKLRQGRERNPDRTPEDSQGRERNPRRESQGFPSRDRPFIRELLDDRGRVYTLISTGRPQPQPLLEPGPAGVGMRLAVAAVISALVSFLLARYLAAPLGQLSRASQQLAKGDLAVRVGTPLDQRKDEFGGLARDMDEMAHRLQVSQQANQRLLRDVSHELRSPLARLRVALEIARNKDQSQVVAELDRIELESERLENLVDEVLSLLRESTGPAELKITRFDLAELLQDLVETVNYESGEDNEQIELQAHASVSIDADRELLWRVFENLLRNAMLHGTGEDRVKVCLEQPVDGEVQVSVSDSGPGIAEAHIDRVFEPFYRVDEARSRDSGGHGLGLAIAASAVRRHGGSISAANREQGGLEVRVVLPSGA
jgi:two-component system sensor histidine kinase CpxA